MKAFPLNEEPFRKYYCQCGSFSIFTGEYWVHKIWLPLSGGWQNLVAPPWGLTKSGCPSLRDDTLWLPFFGLTKSGYPYLGVGKSWLPLSAGLQNLVVPLWG